MKRWEWWEKAPIWQKFLLVFGVVVLLVAVQRAWPGVVTLLVGGVAAAAISRPGGAQPWPWVTALAAVFLALCLAAVFSSVTAGALSLAGKSAGQTGPAVWLGRGEAGPAGMAGRWGLLAGVVLAFLGAAWRRRWGSGGVQHGPGWVRGMRVTRGGWGTVRDLGDCAVPGWPKPGKTGIVLGRESGRLVMVDPGREKVAFARHTLVIGGTGSGKSYTWVRGMIFSCAEAGESMVVTDPKGELAGNMARWLQQRGYEVIVFAPLDPRYSHRWNPIQECRNADELVDLSAAMIECAGADHAFFSGGEKNVLTAVMGYVRWALPPEYCHLKQALSLLAWPQEVLAERFQLAYREGKIAQEIYEAFATAQGHWSNYVEGVRSKLRTVTKGDLAALTSASDFSLDTLGRKKTALFAVLPTEGDLRMVLTPFYGMMFSRLKELALASPGGALPVPVTFIMDEFANIGRVPDIEKLLAVARSMRITICPVLQSLSQLQGLYSREKAWETVLGNTPVKLCLGTDDFGTARYFAGLCGSAEVEAPSWRMSTTTVAERLERPKTGLSRKWVNTLEPEDLLRMPPENCVAVVRGKPPLWLEKVGWPEYPQAREVKEAGTAHWMELAPEQGTDVPVLPVPLESGTDPPERSRSRRKQTTPTPNDIPPSPQMPGPPPDLDALGL